MAEEMVRAVIKELKRMRKADLALAEEYLGEWERAALAAHPEVAQVAIKVAREAEGFEKVLAHTPTALAQIGAVGSMSAELLEEWLDGK